MLYVYNQWYTLYMKTQCPITQGLADNATATYKNSGLIGHTGIDSSCGYGTPINSYWDKEYVYKVLTRENPANDGSGFTGIFTIVEQDGKVFEFLYGHCDPNPGLLGKTITKNTFIGREANNGEVYSGGVRVTLEMQQAGSHLGSHRHDQARELRKDTSIQANTRYLSSLGGGHFFFNDCFYAIPNYNNGLNGCFDWTKLPDVPQAPTPVKEDKFVAFLTSVQKYQLESGILDFKGEKPENVSLGKKTLLQYCKDKKINYSEFLRKLK